MCFGDESKVCCPVDPVGQAVVVTGRLVRGGGAPPAGLEAEPAAPWIVELAPDDPTAICAE